MTEDTLLFSNPNYETALIGFSHDGRAIYNFNKMVEYLVKEDNISEIDAIEFIEYNSIRSLSYYGNMAPIVMYENEENF